MKRINVKAAIVSFFLIVTLFTGISCSDLLDKQPLTSISDSNFWTGESDALLGLAGCYKLTGGNTSAMGLMFIDLAGGNGVDKENSSTLGLASINTIATSGSLGMYWNDAYTHIATFNTFLDKIVSCPMDETKKALWVSEVKCLRAYFLFNLAFYWKDVPMPLTTLTVEEANTIKQTPQSEVYKQIETDLKTAIQILPLKRTASEYSRFNKGAAQVILGRLYLAQQKWSEAAAVFKEIIDSGNYQLDRRYGDDSYMKLFQIGGETSPEMVFCVQNLKDQVTTGYYQFLYPECVGGWHQFAPYNELVKDYFCSDGKDIQTSAVYNDDDPYMNRELRLYASIFLPPVGTYPGTKFNNTTYNCFMGGNTNDSYNRFPLFDGYSVRKSVDPSITSNFGRGYTYVPLMRYAEVLLSYIEAVNESSPSSITQAMLDNTINDVRDRVKLPGIKLSDFGTQILLRNAIRKERRVELAFEGLRYFDVLRWGTAITELNHYFTGVKLSDDPTKPNYRGSGSTASSVDENMYYKFENRAWDSHNRYLPIPQSDLNINKNLKQNEGYN